jgi:hypothetical protein
MSSAEMRWSTAIRALALVAGVLLIVAGVEARALRQARSELQALRGERAQAQSAVLSKWTEASLGEVDHALRWLNTFYAEPTEGFGQTGGLCNGNKLDDGAITTYVVGGFLPARASGQSYEASLAAMRASIENTEQYRTLHPAPPRPARAR